MIVGSRPPLKRIGCVPGERPPKKANGMADREQRAKRWQITPELD
jgi:hypothetical protein